MDNQPFRVLLIDDDAAAADRFGGILARARGDRFELLVERDVPAALLRLAETGAEAVVLETVVLSIITVPELMYEMQTMAAETFTAFDAIFAMAVFYWCLVEVVSRIGRKVEQRAAAFLVSHA